MNAFRYTGLDCSGKTVSGRLEAEDEPAALRRLRRDRVVPLTLRPDRGALLSVSFGGGEALRKTEVTDFTRELATMLGAGQDLDRALRYLTETAPNKRVSRIVGALRDQIRDGSALAAALAAQPRCFSRLYVGLVRAGETGGTLAPTLERLAGLMERERSLAASVQSALIYPVLLLLAALGAVTLLLTQVLPLFVPLFEQNGSQLPASTRFLIDAGQAVSDYGLYALILLLVVVLVVRVALRRPGPRLASDRAILAVPIVGGLAREAMAARFARTLGTLVQNGVALIPALGVVREVLGNEAGVQAVDRAISSAKGGAGLAAPLANSHLFPPRLIHLLRLGEETAQLGPMALRAAEIHEEHTRVATERLVALLTPTITIGMGMVIAGIVSSLMLAMLSLNDLAQ